jgi:hypothetical protein
VTHVHYLQASFDYRKSNFPAHRFDAKMRIFIALLLHSKILMRQQITVTCFSELLQVAANF